MKNRSYIIGSAVLAVLAVCSCVQEFDCNDPENQEFISEGAPYTIFVSSEADDQPVDIATKTKRRDTGQIVWNAEDEILVIHKEVGSNTYIKDGRFICNGYVNSADPSKASFQGTLGGSLTPGKSYDWYAVFPYKDIDIDSADPGSFPIEIICPSDNLDHPSVGDGFARGSSLNMIPLCGSAKGIPGDSQPGIAMKQMVSILKVTIANHRTSTSLPTARIRFNAKGKALAGAFNLDLTGENVVYTPCETAAYSDLTTNFNSIAPGQEHTFYIPFVPFTSDGDICKIAFGDNYNNYTYSRLFTFPEGKEFESGIIYPVQYVIDDNAPTLYLSEIEAQAPVYFPFCQNDTNEEFFKQTDFNSVDNNAYYATVDFYNKAYIPGSTSKRAWLSIKKGTSDGIGDINMTTSSYEHQSTSARYWLFCGSGKNIGEVDMKVNVRFAKIHAGQKPVFYTSLYLGKLPTTNPDDINIAYSYDDGTSWKAPDIEIDESLGSGTPNAKGTLVTLHINKQGDGEKTINYTYPMKVICNAPDADMDNCKFVIRFRVKNIKTSDSDESHERPGGQMGFAPYYEFSSDEGCRAYGKSTSTNQPNAIASENIANDVADDHSDISLEEKQLKHRSAYLILEQS